MRFEDAQELLEKVKQDYEAIADHFAETRAHVWSDISFLVDLIQTGSSVLDLGCGNGRLYDLLADRKVDYTGVDSSERLISLARQRYEGHPATFIQGDALSLPFPDASFDVVIAIAVLHHVPSAGFRAKAVLEAKRVLRPNGLLTITVWNLWQRRYLKYIARNAAQRAAGRSQLDLFDALIPWKSKGGEVIVERYCHAFTLRELSRLVGDAGFKIAAHGYTKRGQLKPNLYVVGRLEND